MNVIVFGATGSIGRPSVRALLDKGHAVTAFARRPERLGFADPALRLVRGDATDDADVAAAMPGHDAAVVTVGAGRQGGVRAPATLNVIRAMQAHGVRRLICQSTLGAHDSRGNLDWFWKHVMFGALLRPAFRDHELQESLVRASGLDWTIVRPSAFTDDPAGCSFREDFGSEDRSLKLRISRADVAGFLVRQIGETRYLRQAVGISC
jgi:uncharacterized protein YbjT (DUF2867 family)